MRRRLFSLLTTYLARILVLAAAYYFSGEVGLRLPYFGTHVTLIWPPVGIALAALYFWGLRYWPGVWLGAFLLNVQLGDSAALASGLAVGNSLGPLLAAWLLRRAGFHPQFDRVLDVFNFVALGACAATVTATNGALSLCLSGRQPWSAYGEIWAGWWLGDAVGILVFAPPLLALPGFMVAPTEIRRRPLKGIAMIAAVLGTALVILLGNQEQLLPLAFVLFLPLLWAALRFGAWTAAWAALMLSLAALWGTAGGTGLFAYPNVQAGLGTLWTFMGTAQLVALLVASLQASSQTRYTLFRSVIRGAPNGIVMVDRRGNIVLVNPQIEQLFGYRAKELIGKSIEVLVPERWRPDHTSQRGYFWDDPHARDMGARRELFGRRKDGSEFPVEIGLNPIATSSDAYVLASVIDITSRKQAEEALLRAHEELERRVEQRTETLAQTNRQLSEEIAERLRVEEALRLREQQLHEAQQMAQIGSWEWDLRANKLYWSPEMCRIHGLSSEQAVSSYEEYLDFVHPDDRARVQRLVERALQSHQPFVYAHRIVWPDGTIRDLTGRGRLVINENGQIVKMLGTGQDITERKRMEAELAEMRLRLEQSREAERIWLAQELHDLPLQEVYGLQFRLKALAALVSHEDAAPHLEGMWEGLEQLVRTLRGLVNELRPPLLAAFGLAAAIDAHAQHVQRRYPELAIHLDLAEDELEGELADAVGLALFRIYQQALNNVVRHAGARHVYVRLRADAECVVLEVEDDGRGFVVPDHWLDLARHNHFGLVGSAERAEHVGGHFEVVSAPGSGTTVRISVARSSVGGAGALGSPMASR